ncbi:GNAT family N-acetyltransferase [Mariniflexile ostreae]|uniref:GNAT family N-acetyltransferase n=1 Tax=Mariniflexile ostreae TaxID=1520892 RepID=A0ABV5FDQ2_9FLAO
MIENYIIKRNFYFSLFEKNSIPPIYKSVAFHAKTIYKNKEQVTKKQESKLHSYTYVPDYLSVNTSENLKTEKVFQKAGFAAHLDGCESVEHYLNANCKTNFRGNVRRPLKRLETCLNIEYKMFYGAIDTETYAFLMDRFYQMLKRRFEQRNDKNIVLQQWDFYLKNSLKSIIQKKACLFVIYHNDKPIAFSLNFIFNKVFYFAIPTFDLDYAKFTLGNTVIYKNLEWCIENKFSLFDMGYGGFENKLNWCNTRYNFEHHVIYSTKTGIGKRYAFLLKHKYNLINYLLAKGVNTALHDFKNKIKNSKKTSPNSTYTITKVNHANELDSNTLIEIDVNTEAYGYLRKPVYDFLYLNTERFNEVKVYHVKTDNTHFLIKGKKSQALITNSHLVE